MDSQELFLLTTLIEVENQGDTLQDDIDILLTKKSKELKTIKKKLKIASIQKYQYKQKIIISTDIGLELIKSIKTLRELANNTKENFDNDNLTLYYYNKSNRCYQSSIINEMEKHSFYSNPLN